MFSRNCGSPVSSGHCASPSLSQDHCPGVIGTLNVFEAARDAGRPVRVVYASSSAVCAWAGENNAVPRSKTATNEVLREFDIFLTTAIAIGHDYLLGCNLA